MIIMLGGNSSNGEFGITIGTDQWECRWGQDSGGGRNLYNVSTFSGREEIIHAVFDSTEAAQADRCKFYINNSLQTPAASTIPSSEALVTQSSGQSFTLGNRPSANRQADAAIWYCEIGTGVLTADQISDSYDALILDTDSDWQGTPAADDTSPLLFSGAL